MVTEGLKATTAEQVAAAQEREVSALAECHDLKREIGVAERYLHDARQRIALLSNELEASKNGTPPPPHYATTRHHRHRRPRTARP